MNFGTDLTGKVALLDRNEDAAEIMDEKIRKDGYIAKAYKVNVLDKSSLEEANTRINAELGSCDILLNGAGGNNAKANTTKEYYEMGDEKENLVTFFDLDQEGIEFVFNLNFIGTLLPSQVFAKDMVGKKDCTIINISSMNAYH